MGSFIFAIFIFLAELVTRPTLVVLDFLYKNFGLFVHTRRRLRRWYYGRIKVHFTNF